jgi:hypothetical protein
VHRGRAGGSACRCLGISAICNLVSAIKTAKYFEYGPRDMIFLSLDRRRWSLYASRVAEQRAAHGPYDRASAARPFRGSLPGSDRDRSPARADLSGPSKRCTTSSISPGLNSSSGTWTSFAACGIPISGPRLSRKRTNGIAGSPSSIREPACWTRFSPGWGFACRHWRSSGKLLQSCQSVAELSKRR